MNVTLAGIVLITLYATTAQGQGAIQKCVGADGKIVYQDTPCDAKQKTAATLQRDRTQADSTALHKAQAERDLSKQLSARRAAEYAADQAKLEPAPAAPPAQAQAQAPKPATYSGPATPKK